MVEKYAKIDKVCCGLRKSKMFIFLKKKIKMAEKYVKIDKVCCGLSKSQMFIFPK